MFTRKGATEVRLQSLTIYNASNVFVSSTITTWGKDREKEAFQNMMDRIPDGAISIVSDSYNIWEACDRIWGKALKDCVIERGQRGGKIVIRPDSGKPEEVVVKVNTLVVRVNALVVKIAHW